MSEEALQACVDRHLELQRLLPLEKIGLVERSVDGDCKRRITLRPQGWRRLHEARETAANACRS